MVLPDPDLELTAGKAGDAGGVGVQRAFHLQGFDGGSLLPGILSGTSFWLLAPTFLHLLKPEQTLISTSQPHHSLNHIQIVDNNTPTNAEN